MLFFFSLFLIHLVTLPGAQSSTGQQFVQVLQQQHFAPRPVIGSPSRSGLPPANLPPSQNLLPLSSVEVGSPSSNVVPVPPVQVTHGTLTVFSSNALSFPPSSMAHSLQIRSAPHGLAPHLLASTTSMSVPNLQHQNGSRLNQQQVFNDMGIAWSASEQILPMSGSHPPEDSGTLHLCQSTSPATWDFPSHLSGSCIGVKRPNPDS